MSNNTELTSGTIFDENGYDEMQKTQNHEIGFRLFRIMFFVVLLFTIILTVVCGAAEDAVGMALSLVLFGIMMLFYVLYAYMTAKKGIMNPKFAGTWSKPWVVIVYIILGGFWIFRLVREIVCEAELSDIANCVIWLILISESVLMSLCAGINNRVLKARLEED